MWKINLSGFGSHHSHHMLENIIKYLLPSFPACFPSNYPAWHSYVPALLACCPPYQVYTRGEGGQGGVVKCHKLGSSSSCCTTTVPPLDSQTEFHLCCIPIAHVYIIQWDYS